jgi:large conductance mechanosensitive channel
VIVAFVIFMVIKGMNSMQKKEAAKPSPPPDPPADVKLLGEIRDLLKNR